MEVFSLTNIFIPVSVFLAVVVIYCFSYITKLKTEIKDQLQAKTEEDEKYFNELKEVLNKLSDKILKFDCGDIINSNKNTVSDVKEILKKLNSLEGLFSDTKHKMDDVINYPDKLSQVFMELFSNFSTIVNDIKFIRDKVDKSSNKDLFMKLDVINTKLTEMQGKMEGVLTVVGTELFKNKNEGL